MVNMFIALLATETSDTYFDQRPNALGWGIDVKIAHERLYAVHYIVSTSRSLQSPAPIMVASAASLVFRPQHRRNTMSPIEDSDLNHSNQRLACYSGLPAMYSEHLCANARYQRERRTEWHLAL